MKVNDSIKSPLNLGLDKPGTDKAGAERVVTSRLDSGVNAKAERAQADASVAGNVTLSARSAQLASLEAKVATSKF